MLANTLFPVRRITWGVYSGSMKAFLSTEKGKQDTFSTWIACTRFIISVYGHVATDKQCLYAKPKKIYLYDELTPEEV